MIILVDQDNVLNDFIAGSVRYIKKLYNLDVNFSKEDCRSYGVFGEIFPHLSKENISEMTEKIFNAENFWLDLPLQDNAYKVLEKLVNKHEVYIATAPWPTSKNCIPEKTEWVRSRLPFFDVNKIIFCNNKRLLKADIIIDDSPIFINKNSCDKTIIFDYPYNRDSTGTRVKDWMEISEYFKLNEVI